MTVTKRELLAKGFDQLDMDAVIYVDTGVHLVECSGITVVTDPDNQIQRGEFNTHLDESVPPVGSLILRASN